jgi:hypothetical protein
MLNAAYPSQQAGVTSAGGVYAQITPKAPENLDGAIQRLTGLVTETQEIAKRVGAVGERLVGSQPENTLGGLGIEKDYVRTGSIGGLHNVIDGLSRELGSIRSRLSHLETA